MRTSSLSCSRLLRLFIFFLACALVFWGLHDKVSLYKRVSRDYPVAKAKILSGRELARDAVYTAAPRPPAELPPVAAVYFAAALVLLCTDRLFEPSRHRLPLPDLDTSGLMNPLYRRPPPRAVSRV